MGEASSVVVVCDSREARSGVAVRLGQQRDIKVEQAELDCGDYAVGDRLLVERKAATDFILSIMDGRLFEQAAKMASRAENRVMLLEGNPLATRSEMAPESILGAMSALPVFFGVCLLQSCSTDESAMLIGTMALHISRGLGYEIPLRSSKPKTAALTAQFLAEGLPGVGPTTARKLLDHFGTPRELFRADVNNLMKVKGIGAKTAEQIALALDTKAGQWQSTKTR